MPRPGKQIAFVAQTRQEAETQSPTDIAIGGFPDYCIRCPTKQGRWKVRGTSRNGLIAVDQDTALAEPNSAERLASVFNRLARQLRERRLLREENERLRDENEQLREALSDCVETCDRFLAPTLDDLVPEDEDRARARDALEVGRRLLGERPALPE